MSTQPDDPKRIEEVERLANLPQFPNRPLDRDEGVLLSDRIRHYCERYKLISPFDLDQLRPASYALRVGRRCSVGGKQKALDDGVPLEIKPYQVAIIETFETISLPPYLIGRWNVQTKKAYKGLLWVGGAQVDPGFRGHLCCPIYNLSTESVILNFKDTLAVIDFETTTPYEVGKCLLFDWAERNMLLFSDYPYLDSGIEAKVKNFDDRIESANRRTNEELTAIRTQTAEKLSTARDKSEEAFRNVQSRIDTFLTLIFTVVAVLFAALGIIATKGSIEPSFLNAPVWISAIALFFGLRAHVEVKASLHPHRWYATLSLVLAITGVIVFGCYSLRGHERYSSNEIRQVKEEASRAASALDQERKERDVQTRAYEARFEALQQQVNLIVRNPASKK